VAEAPLPSGAVSAATAINGSEDASGIADAAPPGKETREYHAPLQAEVAASLPSDAPDVIEAPSQERIAALRNRYMNHAATRTIIDHFGTRQRNQSETKLAALEAALRRDGTPLPLQEIKDVMKHLENLGLGRYIVSRHKKPTRFKWSDGVELMALRCMAEEHPAPDTDPRGAANGGCSQPTGR
jgi:hypothetical protein